MTDECELTGLSKEDANLYGHYHSFLVNDTKFSLPSNEILKGFEKPLQRTISNHLLSANDKKRRDGLFRHLEKSLTSKFKDSSLVMFGSSASGLSLKSGDLDLCLQIPNINEKKAIKKVSSMLRGQGMESIETITKAKIPIVKFKDPRSNIFVDISINNSLAIYNTKLLQEYCAMDKRVNQLVIVIKHWAIHRNISDAWSGTFSSYAWTILAINHLIQQNVIPNLQESDSRTIAKVDGVEYDLTISDKANLDEKSDATISKLLCTFFHNYATRDWDDLVVSIRNGSDLKRKDKGWRNEPPSAIEVLRDDNLRLGKHHMAIEDPFDPDLDLSRVLRAEGELRIKNELLRACDMFCNGSTWKAICETVDKQRLDHLEPDDLFHDLRDKPDSVVENMLEKVKAELSSLEKRVRALEDERHSNIRMAKAMRGVIEETSDIRKEHKSIINGLKERSKLIEDIKSQRDKINSDIILPIHMIEDELSKVYTRLTEELDIHRVPSLEREKEHFSWFMELQAMHAKAREASELHQRFVESIKLQKEEIGKLKIYETQHDEATSKLLEQEPLLKDKDINHKEMMSFDRRVQKLQKIVSQRRSELHKLRREIGRLEAWMRKKTKQKTSQGFGRKRGRGKTQTSSKPTSGPVTLGDLSSLLSTIEKEDTSKKVRKVSSKKAGMKKLGNLGAHRGSRGSFKKKE